jgi:hypothetical protein
VSFRAGWNGPGATARQSAQFVRANSRSSAHHWQRDRGPPPGGATPNILNITPTTAANPTPVAGGPSYPQNLILGYTWVPSDDGKFALTEIVMRDRSAFPAILALPGVTAFIKGVNKLADIQTAFQQYKKDFDPTKFGAWVR